MANDDVVGQAAVRKFISPHRKFSGAWVPNWLLSRPEVSHGAKLVYALLCQSERGTGSCHPRVDDIGKETAMSGRQIQRYIQELSDNALIDITDRRAQNQPSVYRFYDHPWMNRPPDMSDALTSEVSSGLTSDPSPALTSEVSGLRIRELDPENDLREKDTPFANLKRRKKETAPRLWPEDLILTKTMIAYAHAAGIDPAREFIAWKNDCAAHGRKYVSWEAAWRTRIDKAPAFNSPARISNGNRQAHFSPGHQALIEAIIRDKEMEHGSVQSQRDSAEGVVDLEPTEYRSGGSN